MSELFLAIGFGLVVASVLALSAVGLSLQFGITNYINFAYGDFMAVGAYIVVDAEHRASARQHLGRDGRRRTGRRRPRGTPQPVPARAVCPAIPEALLHPHRHLRPLAHPAEPGQLDLGDEVQHYDISNQSRCHIGPFLFTGDQLVVIAHRPRRDGRCPSHAHPDTDRQVDARDVGQLDARHDQRHRHASASRRSPGFCPVCWPGIGGTVLGITQASITPGVRRDIPVRHLRRGHRRRGRQHLRRDGRSASSSASPPRSPPCSSIPLTNSISPSRSSSSPCCSGRTACSPVPERRKPCHPSSTTYSRSSFFVFAYCILGWGLNLQFGEGGILNFAYIGFVAIGAYVTGALSLGKPTAGCRGRSYILGSRLPFPIGLILGGRCRRASLRFSCRF